MNKVRTVRVLAARGCALMSCAAIVAIACVAALSFVAPANASPSALSAKARAVLCADAGHEDGVPASVSEEYLVALRALWAAGSSGLEAARQLTDYGRLCQAEVPQIGLVALAHRPTSNRTGARSLND